MSGCERPIAAPFPTPPPLIVGLFDELRLAAERPPETREELRWLAEAPRPWDPPTCPSTLQQQLWNWLDEVVAWINEEHNWRVARLIPIWWMEHPHIAHETASLACLRHNASYAVTPDPLEDCHATHFPPSSIGSSSEWGRRGALQIGIRRAPGPRGTHATEGRSTSGWYMID